MKKIMIVKQNMIAIMQMSTKIFKTEVMRFGFFALVGLVSFGCKESMDNNAYDIVEKSVEAHGGLEAWRNIKTLSFDKTTMLFLEDGSIERRTDQRQTFHFKPTLKGTIENYKSPEKSGYTYDDGSYFKTENDSTWQVTSQKEIDALKYSFFAAHYVTCQPFELLSENAQLTYGGETTINDRQCHIINVSYMGDNEDADKWSYIFDAQTYDLVANKVILSDHTSWIENLTYDTSTGLKFNEKRKSYRLNDKGEKTYLRAEYFYSNYSVTY